MTATLKLPADLNGHGAGMRPPAPAWLVEGTPGAPVLAKTLDEANEAAIQAQDAYRAAILAQHKELDHLVRRDGITPEAAHAVIRGRRQAQHAELERKRALEASVAGLFK